MNTFLKDAKYSKFKVVLTVTPYDEQLRKEITNTMKNSQYYAKQRTENGIEPLHSIDTNFIFP